MTSPITTWPLVIPYVPLASILNDEKYSAIETCRRAMLLRFAASSDLTVIGQNYGIPRLASITADDLFRKLVPVLAWQPKMVLSTTYALLNAIFGTQADLVLAGKRPWRVYEVVANEIVIEIPQALITASNDTATYYQGWNGYAYNATALPTDTFTTDGDVRACSATTLVGQNLYAYVGGVWTAYSIVSISYDSVTKQSTIQIGSASIPVGGTVFFVLPTGDGVQSYVGDYYTPSGQVATFTTDPGVGTTNTIRMPGDFTNALEVSNEITIIYNGQPHTASVSTTPAFDTTLQRTSFDIAPTAIPLGITNGVLVKATEVADSATPTAPHADRVYYTGNGLYDIFDYYFNLLVRAAGVVLRLERI